MTLGNLVLGLLRPKRLAPAGTQKRSLCRQYGRCHHGLQRKIGVQSIPFAKGQYKPGVDLGPQAILNTGLISHLTNGGYDVKDYGSIDFTGLPNEAEKDYKNESSVVAHNTSAVGIGNKLISQGTSRVLRDGRFCLNLGGDHSMAIGTVSGASQVYNDLAVLWVDAHSDINLLSTTTTGNYHGMPLGFLVKDFEPRMPKLEPFSWLQPRLKASNLAFIGLRDVEPLERQLMDEYGILAFSMKDVHDLGITNVLQIALNHICPGGKRPLHLSFDIDAMDDLEVKATIMPTPGGLTLREALALAERVGQMENLVSMDLVEINPLIGTRDDLARTTEVAKQILLSVCGYYRGSVGRPSRHNWQQE